MALSSEEEVVAFLQANRLMFADKPGFKHYAGKLSDVIAYIEKLSAENAELRAKSSDEESRNAMRSDS